MEEKVKVGEERETLEIKVARIEGEVTQINQRLGDLRDDFNRGFEDFGRRFTELREDFNRRLGELREEIRELRNRFWWLLGIQITMWVTIILAILFGR